MKSDAYKTYNQQQGEAMDTEIKGLIKLLTKEFDYAQDDFDQDHDNYYYLGRANAFRQILDYVLDMREEDFKERNEWATIYQSERIKA